MNVLIACEESQTVCAAFRQLGFNAYSCDIVECSGEHPEWHFNVDIFDVIKRKGGVTQSGNLVFVDKWDLMIAHPPCTFLSSSGAKWYYHPDDKDLPIEQRRPHPRFPHRKQDQDAAVDFFMALYNTNIPYIAIENPVGVMSSRFRKPDQQFDTCVKIQSNAQLYKQAGNSVSIPIVYELGKKIIEHHRRLHE